MLEKFYEVLLRIAVALEGGADVTGEPKKPRGRPAKGETTPPTTEQLASAQSAAAASTAQTAAAVTAVGSATVGDKPVITAPTLQQVADKITDLANADRAKAVAILAAHGVKKVPELKPEQFESVLKAIALATAPSAADSLV